LRWACDNSEQGCNEGMTQGTLSDGGDEEGVDFAWDRDGM